MPKELIQKGINALERKKSNSIKKHNILKLLDNIGAIFTGAYLHYKDVPKETIFERSIAERAKLKENQKTQAINCLKNTLLIIKVQVICTKYYARQKMQGMRIQYI